MSDAQQRDANVRLSADVDPYSRQLQSAAQDTDKLSQAVDKLSAKLDGLTKRAGKKLLLFGAGGAAGIVGLTAEAAAFEKQLSTLNATAAITNTSMGKTTDTIRGLAKQFPISRTAAVELVSTLDTLGVRGSKNVNLVADSLVKLSAASGDDLGTLTTQMVELQRQMGTLSSGTMDVFANSLLTVSKNAGVSASGVLSFAQAIAPAARAAQLSQAELVGVSTAFTKAGQDGYAAANTFNGMLQDITRQVVNGSPEIAKYANLIGVTSAQFKTMDKGQAVAAIFDTINKQGPDAIKTLDRLGYDGVRALKSIQAVSQSGGLTEQIAAATGAYQSTNNLNTGSAAAMSGMNDQLERTRNMMQDIATESGTPFLRVLTLMAAGFNAILGPLEPLIAGLGKLTALVAGGGTLAALGLGTAMVGGRVLTALAGYATIRKGVGMYAKEGYQAGRAMETGGSLVGNESARRYAADELRYYQKGPYLLGQAVGRLGGAGTIRGGVLGPALGLPLKAGRMVLDAQTQFYANAAKSGFEREAPVLGGIGNIGTALRHPRQFVAGFKEGGQTDFKAAGAARDADEFGKSLRSGTDQLLKKTTAEREAMTVTQRLGKESALLAGAFARMQYTAVGTGLKTAAGGLARGGAGLLGAIGMGNPYIGGAVLAGGLGYLAYKTGKTQGAVDIGDSAPIDKYNAALGIATSELGTFADAVKAATAQLPHATTLSGASTVSSDVISLAKLPKRQLTNDLFDNLKYGGSRAAMMQLMGITDPRQLQLVQADLVQSRGIGTAQQATDIFLKRQANNQGVNYGALVHDINTEQGQGLKGHLGYADPTGAKITSAIYTSLMAQYGADSKNVNAAYAGQHQVNATRNFLGAALAPTSDNRTMYQAVQGYEKAFLPKGVTLGFKSDQYRAATMGMTQKERTDYFFQHYLRDNDNKQVQSYVKDLKAQGISLGDTSPANLAKLRTSADSAYTAGIKATGAIGATALGQVRVQNAVNSPGDLNAQYQGIQELLSGAKAVGGTLSGTDAQLQKLKAAIGDVNDPLYKLADAAQALNSAQRAAAMGYQSRSGQLGNVIGSYREIQGEDASAPDHQQRLNDQRQAVEAQKQSYYQYMVSVVQAQKNFGIQMERGEQDRNLQIFRSNRDFNIQMLQASQDFYISRARQERDFNISQQRSQADFARSMARQAEDAAKAMYDPYTRVQSEYTASSGTLLQNLQDQNQRFADQEKNLRKLHSEGLTKNAINQLDLSNPAQAQQVQRLIDDVAQDPGQIGKINKQAARRVKIGGALTNSPLNEQYARQVADFDRMIKRGEADFARGLSDAAKDFSRQATRASDAHARALADMAHDWTVQVDRSKEDLARMSVQVFGSFEGVMDKAIRLVTRNLGTAGSKVIAELDKVKKKFPELFADLYSDNPKPGQAVSADTLDGSRTRTIPSASGRRTGATHLDHSTHVSGTFTVVSNDPKKLAQDLANQTRVKKLTRPTLGN